MLLLRGAVQHYEWGDQRAIPEFLGTEPNAQPWAELWWGTHRGGPSLVMNGAGATPLSDVVGDLSFLVKFIAAAKPLSLQTHPNDDQARSGFQEENEIGIPLDAPQRIYRDASPKPELLIALTSFDAICGFRPLELTYQLCGRYGWKELEDHLRADGLAETVRWALTTGPKHLPENMPAWAARIAALYPGNGGVLVALLMHHLRLAPGEAIFLGAGNVHAYLSGTGIEIMTNSDNVVRAAFTRKHVNVDEFLAVARFDEIDPPIMQPLRQSDTVLDYPANTTRFGAQRIEVNGRQSIVATHDAEIVVCTDGDAKTIRRGQAVVLRSGDSLHMEGSATVFRAWGNH
jgi:mannose-6-phosphate isomerase